LTLDIIRLMSGSQFSSMSSEPIEQVHRRASSPHHQATWISSLLHERLRLRSTPWCIGARVDTIPVTALHSSQFPELCFSWHRYQQTLSASLCGASDYGWNGDDCYQQSSNKCFSCSCDKLFHSRLPESFAQRCLKSVASVSGRIHLSDTLPWTAVSGREPTFEHFF